MHYPLFLTFREKVSGTKFLAEVIFHGRLLADREEEGWWMYGVEPGGVAAGGLTPTEAYVEFCRALREVLYDIASETENFDQFKQQVLTFFHEKNGPTEVEWAEAVDRVRNGNISERDILVGNRPIPRRAAESPRSVEVKPLRGEDATPQDNEVESSFTVAA